MTNRRLYPCRIVFRLATVLASLALVPLASLAAEAASLPRPNILLILADDLGFSDLGSYGSEIPTPNLDALAARGLRFTQFYNAARCCPTRAALLTGLYPHQAGVGHMLQNWSHIAPAYSSGLNNRCVTFAELLRPANYRTYHLGKWHVGGFNQAQPKNFPLDRGFDRYYGTAGGGNYFLPKPLFLDRQERKPEEGYYLTDALSARAVEFLEEHARDHRDKTFFMHLCYTAPHFPLHAKPEDIARYRGKYRKGWDALRERRFSRQKELGIITPGSKLSPRDPEAQSWTDVVDKDEWDHRMAVYAGMVDRMDQGIGRVLEAIRRMGVEQNTLVIFLSDNGASAEALDSWPDPARGHQPESVLGTRESHRCLEVGWANAANTPFREHKMWAHEGGIATPFIASWPAGIKARGELTHQVGHVIDLMPTLLDLAGLKYPRRFQDRELTAVEGKSLAPVLQGKRLGQRTLAWEHEGNRAIRVGDWKLVARFRGDWELYNLAVDRTELNNLASSMPAKVKQLDQRWQDWANRVGAVPWERLPASSYQPSKGYRKKSEPVKE